MKKIATLLLTLTALIMSVAAGAQSRNATLTIRVSAVGTENLEGQPVVLEQTDYSVSYGNNLTLDAAGTLTLKVYPGNHRLTVARDGYETVEKTFTVADADPAASVSVSLVEKTRTPFALKAAVSHDPFTGRNDVALGWNVEAPAFFDDFESYDPFAVSFGQWTGIDADGESTGALQGTYPNRGIRQYAQIINPLTVVPTWWYDYPILRPYSGNQYVGFIRTETGNANDDWLISPAVTVGTDNTLEFMAKAADRYDERFMVYVTTKTDNPGVDDFVRIDLGNYEVADYRGWKRYTYDLSAYAGQTIKFAIRYISDYNRNRSFMLMVDDVYVGQPSAKEAQQALHRARRVSRSAANPYETFNIYLDGVKAGSTADYAFTLENVAAGDHTVGIEAVYQQAVSPVSTIGVSVSAGPYAKVNVSVTALSKLAADKVDVSMINFATGEAVSLTTAAGKATLLSLPTGTYSVHVDEGVYEAYSKDVVISGDTDINIELTDKVVDPYNITVDQAEGETSATVRWNQELGFEDSFEDYDDFATGQFGDWRTVDVDKLPVYPIGLGSTTNIVSFPGSGTASNPAAIAPMVFNPLKTVPAMSPADPAIEAADGVKSVIFFSPQRAQADKWLISPVIKVRDNYRVAFSAKAYASQYPETFEIAVAPDGSTNPADFLKVASIESLPSTGWGSYTMDLMGYEGMSVRIGLHYVSYDSFLAQVDDFKVGKADGSGDFVDYGNVVSYEIYLDGIKVGESQTPEYVLTDVTPGEHRVGICAVYTGGKSATVEYTFSAKSGISGVIVDNNPAREIYDISGRRLTDCSAPGIYIIRQGGKTFKIKK